MGVTRCCPSFQIEAADGVIQASAFQEIGAEEFFEGDDLSLWLVPEDYVYDTDTQKLVQNAARPLVYEPLLSSSQSLHGRTQKGIDLVVLDDFCLSPKTTKGQGNQWIAPAVARAEPPEIPVGPIQASAFKEIEAEEFSVGSGDLALWLVPEDHVYDDRTERFVQENSVTLIGAECLEKVAAELSSVQESSRTHKRRTSWKAKSIKRDLIHSDNMEIVLKTYWDNVLAHGAAVTA